MLLPSSSCHLARGAGSVAERSKALDLGSSLYRGVGSNPTAASFSFFFEKDNFQHAINLESAALQQVF